AASFARAMNAARGVSPNVTCVQQTLVLGTQAGKETTVGEVHTASDAQETFHYGKTSDSDISVGFSADDAGFSISGTTHISTSVSNADLISVNNNNGHRVSEQFTYQHQKIINNCAATFYQHVATKWETGIALGDGNSDLDGNCPPV